MSGRRSIAAWLLLAAAVATGASGQTPSAGDGWTLPCPLDAPYNADNVFARIVRGDLPASIVAQDARVMAILPLEWERPGHVLVIPRRPVGNLYDLGDRDLVAVMAMVRRIATAQRRALGSSGFSLQQNNASNQHVCHLHVHVIPNTPRVPMVHATRAEMDAMAQRLRAALPAR